MTFTACLAPSALVALMLTSTLAFGEACDVNTRPASAGVPVVQTHTCFEYKGMPAGSNSRAGITA